MRALVTNEYAEWFEGLDDGDARIASIAVFKLEAMGLGLPYPHSSNIEGARFGIRELRPKAGASPLRIFYAFDPRREAVLLIGGDKSNSKRMYERLIPMAEAIFERYLGEMEARYGY